MADKSEVRMNLAAIKRVDPYAKDILDISAHVAFYTFNVEENGWEKTDVEGAFFVYRRNAEPFSSVFINNRLNTNSLVEPLTAGVDLQNQAPFLLYRNERGRIRGFWFYHKSECDRLSELIGRLIKEAEPMAERQAVGASADASAQPFDFEPFANSNVDIFSMLTKAQQDFNNALIAPKAGGSGVSGASAPAPQQTRRMANEKKKRGAQPPPPQKSGPSKSGPPKAGPPVQITAPNNGTSQSVMNFFAAVKPTTPATDAPHMPQPIHIDQIENQIKTPLKEKQATLAAKQQPKTVYAHGSSGAQSIDSGLNLLRLASPSKAGTSPLATFIASNNLTAMKAPSSVDVRPLDAHYQRLDALQLLKPPTAAQAYKSLPGTPPTTPNKPTLMPPTMFESTASDASDANRKAASARDTQPNAAGRSRQQLMHDPAQPQPLTEAQQLQAIAYLTKTDPSFSHRMHDAYLKSVAEMAQ